MRAAGRGRALRRILVYLRPQAHLVAAAVCAAVVVLGATTAMPLVVRSAIDGAIARQRLDALPAALSLLLSLAVVELAAGFVQRYFANLASLRLEHALRGDFYAHLQALHLSFHATAQSGQLLSRAIADIQAVRLFAGFGIVFGAFFGAFWITVVVILLTLDWPLAVVTAFVALPTYLVSRGPFRRYGAIARRVQDRRGDLATVVDEMASGVRVVRAFGREALLLDRFRSAATALLAASREGVRARARTAPVLKLIPSLGLGAVLLIGGQQVAHAGLSVGSLFAFMAYLVLLVAPLDAMIWILALAEDAISASARLADVLDARPQIADGPCARPMRPAVAGVRFEGVGFRHPDADGWVLRGLDLEVEPGETLAVVGATGSGKTTMAALVPRLLDCVEGRVTVGGIDVRNIRLASLRASLGVTFEEPVLFSASVRENLLMGRPAVPDAELERALALARAAFVRDLPWGLDTRIGEHGLSLSGGQRQQLALARALLGAPRVVVLDDPLSSVDVPTEREIEQALRRALEGVTALLVARRPSTLALADRIALLEAGRVAAVGTHEELLRTQPAYQALMGTGVEIG